MGGNYTSDQYRLILFWSQKCGCSTVYEIFKRYVLRRGFKRFDPEFFRRDLSDPRYATFTKVIVMRNPFARVFSLFLNKLVFYNGRRLERLEDLEEDFRQIVIQSGKAETGMSFRDLIDWILGHGESNPHSRRQIQPENLLFDRVVHLENLEEELRTAVPQVEWGVIPRVNATRIPGPTTPVPAGSLSRVPCFALKLEGVELSAFVTDDIRQDLLTHFADDFLIGGYPRSFP